MDTSRFPDGGINLDPAGGTLPALPATAAGAIVRDPTSGALVRWTGAAWEGITGGGYLDVTRTEVLKSGANTIYLHGWFPVAVQLSSVYVFATTVATVGAYTLALEKDYAGTPANMLSAATFDLTTAGTMVADVPTPVPLSAVTADITLPALTPWRAAIVSDNAGLDVAGLVLQLNWLPA